MVALSIRSSMTWSPLLGPIRLAVSLSSHPPRHQRGVAHCGAVAGAGFLTPVLTLSFYKSGWKVIHFDSLSCVKVSPGSFLWSLVAFLFSFFIFFGIKQPVACFFPLFISRQITLEVKKSTELMFSPLFLFVCFWFLFVWNLSFHSLCFWLHGNCSFCCVYSNHKSATVQCRKKANSELIPASQCRHLYLASGWKCFIFNLFNTKEWHDRHIIRVPVCLTITVHLVCCHSFFPFIPSLLLFASPLSPPTCFTHFTNSTNCISRFVFVQPCYHTQTVMFLSLSSFQFAFCSLLSPTQPWYVLFFFLSQILL